jgi:hypothetical protein
MLCPCGHATIGQTRTNQDLSGYDALADNRSLLKSPSCMQCGLRQIELHHTDNYLNKLHEAENVPATAESNGFIFLAAFWFRYGPCLMRMGVTYRTKWDVEPAHQSTCFSSCQVPSGS